MAGRFVLDANVLYSARLRDLFLQLRRNGVAEMVWTARIEAEWTAALIAARPDLTEAVEATVRLIRERFALAYLPDDAVAPVAIGLPDAGDEHVAQAALAIDAVIVTFNTADFPQTTLDRHGLRAITPDECLSKLIASHGEGVAQAVRAIRARLIAPAVSAAAHADGMDRAGCPSFAAWLRQRLDQI